MDTVFDTFTEGISVITWACTLPIAVPGLALVLVARRARVTVGVLYAAGVALMAWAPAAGYWRTDMRGLVVVVVAVLAAGTYLAAWKAPTGNSPLAAGGGFVGGAVASWLWRPCVGPRLGDILNEASTDELRTLALMGVYTVGALLPLLLLAMLPVAVPVVGRVLDRMPFAVTGAVVGGVYAITLAIGLYDNLIGEMYRISSGN